MQVKCCFIDPVMLIQLCFEVSSMDDTCTQKCGGTNMIEPLFCNITMSLLSLIMPVPQLVLMWYF